MIERRNHSFRDTLRFSFCIKGAGYFSYRGIPGRSGFALLVAIYFGMSASNAFADGVHTFEFVHGKQLYQGNFRYEFTFPEFTLLENVYHFHIATGRPDPINLKISELRWIDWPDSLGIPPQLVLTSKHASNTNAFLTNSESIDFFEFAGRGAKTGSFDILMEVAFPDHSVKIKKPLNLAFNITFSPSDNSLENKEPTKNSSPYSGKIPAEKNEIIPPGQSQDYLTGLLVGSIVIITLLSFLAFLLFRSKRKRKRASNILNRHEKPSPKVPVLEINIPEPEVVIEAVEESSPVIMEVAEPIVNLPREEPQHFIQIKRKEKPPVLSVENFRQVLPTRGRFLKLDLNDLWSDSSVGNVFLAVDFISDISSFLRGYHAPMDSEMAGNKPEIGGMIMGTCAYDDRIRQFMVAAEKFIPIQSNNLSPYSLEFSVDSLATELGYIQDLHPDLRLVGWFHTHPGHGLFLSKQDLQLHEGHFRDAYQFAMEIDSMTPGLDTAFFTRKGDNRLNNKDRLRPGRQWFSWKKIDEFRREEI